MRKYHRKKKGKKIFEILLVLGLLVFSTRYIDNSFYDIIIYGVATFIVLVLAAGSFSKFRPVQLG